jgi:hypothetical protein
MAAMYLVDTNVMLAASAVHELSNLRFRAMPREIEYREMVYEWLADFEQSDRRIVLDEAGLVRDEYERNIPYNMREQEYGLRVLQSKIDRCLDVHVPIVSLQGNGEHIAVLEPAHEQLVKHRADRKWVACALASKILFDEMPPIAYGAETDWYFAEEGLKEIGLSFHRLLPDAWYEKHKARG